MNIEGQIKLMKEYAAMMLEREDWHGLWDAAIDLARLTDKMNLFSDKNEDEIEKFTCNYCKKYFFGKGMHFLNKDYCTIACARKDMKREKDE
jgi:hypothetical protein